MKGHLLLAVGLLGVLLATQQAIAAPATKPNILVIFGDDIGIANISAYSGGLMGYETPNIDRIGKEGIRFLHYYGEQSCTAGRSAFLTGQHIIRTGLEQGWFSRRADGHEPGRSVDRRPVAQSGLRHRPVRQEPRRRSQRVAAHGQRLRRILRQPLSPQRRRRAGVARLSEGSGVSRPSSVRAACSTAKRPTRTIRPSIRASARSASRRSKTPAR